MGFKTLDSVLNFEANIIPARTTCAIIDNGLKASGEFLIHHFISQYLNAPAKPTVLFLAFDSIFNHYNLILRKLGCNLSQSQEQGSFVFLDLAVKLGFLSEENEHPGEFWHTILTFCYNQISFALDNLDSKTSKEGAILGAIVLDDLSVLSFFGCPAARITQLLVWLKKQVHIRGASLIVLSHGDAEFENDSNFSAVTHSLLHLSEVWFRVAPLASGHSLDVHGKVTIHAGPNWSLEKQPSGNVMNWLYVNDLPTLHYHLKDNDVIFFPKGTSKGVL